MSGTEDPFAGTEPPSGVDYGNFMFSVKKFVLASLAESASHAVPSKDSPGALGCFQVRLLPGELRLAATDMERAAFAVTGAVSWPGTESRVFYLPAKRLLAILREAPDEDVSFAVKKNQATVEIGTASWTVKLPDSSSYPQLPDLESVEFFPYSRTELLTALRAVRHAICKDAAQPSLTQVSVKVAGEAPASTGDVTASDRTRLARTSLNGFPFSMTLPAGALDDLLRLLSGNPSDDVLVGQTESSLVFRAGAVTVTAGKRTSPFPDMDKQLLVPAVKANTQQLTVDKAELARAVRRVAVNADSQTSAIALRLSDGQVTVEARDKNGNSAFETVMATWAGQSRVLVVNHAYLADMVTAHPSQSCEFWLGPDSGKKLSPLVLISGGSAQVLTRMPAAILGY